MRIVLAYSGGLDTSFCIPYLAEEHDAEVVTVTVNTGGWTEAELGPLEARARALGATDVRIVDARQRTYDTVLRYLLAGNVLRGASYPLSVGAERTVQAVVLAETARALGADAIAHGATGAGNDQVRFDAVMQTLAPGVPIIAPVREHGFSREHETAYLTKRGHEVPAKTATYSINAGLWGTSIGGRETHGSKDPLPESAYTPKDAALVAQAPHTVHLEFLHGNPVSLDGDACGPVAVIERLGVLTRGLGVGRGIHLGDTILGFKGRVGFEAGAPLVLIIAHRELEKLVLTRTQQHVKDALAPVYGNLVHEAQFLDPAARDLETFLAATQARVTGTVHVSLAEERFSVCGAESPHSLLDAANATYGEEAGDWSARDVEGFIRLYALPAVLAARAVQD